jgi:hypothetical protein
VILLTHLFFLWLNDLTTNTVTRVCFCVVGIIESFAKALFRQTQSCVHSLWSRETTTWYLVWRNRCWIFRRIWILF